MAGHGDLVGREELIEPILGSRLGVVWDVRGSAGAGKSELLREVQRRAGPGDVVVLLRMQDYYTPFEAAGGAGDGSRLAGELRRFGQAVSALTSRLLGRQAAARAAGGAILNDIAQLVREAGTLDAADTRRRAGELVERLRDEVNRLVVAQAAAGRRVYLLYDSFDVVLGHPLGEWFLRLLDGLDGSVVAVTRRAGPDAAPLQRAGGLTDPGELGVVQVGGLDPAQVSDYLVRRLGSLGPEIAAAVHQATGGHALAVGLIADVVSGLRRTSGPVDAAGVREQLARLPPPGDAAVLLAGLVDWLIRTTREHEPEIADWLPCLGLVRRFDFALLEALLPAGGHGLAERLVSYSFVDRRAPDDHPAEQYYVVHDQVRTVLRRAAEDQERAREVYLRAEEYYRERTGNFLTGYEGWFRYSDEGWQVLVREWLYHLSCLGESQQAGGRQGAARLFFDAFWWWGCNVPFRFCEELLTDWGEMARGRGDDAGVAWGQELCGLYARWPKGRGAREQATADDWRVVSGHLEFFLARPEISDAAPGSRPMRQLQGQLWAFRGIAERYQDPGSGEAADCFRRARALLGDGDSAWAAAWVSFHQADALLASGDHAAAVAVAEQAWAELAQLGDDDFELAASLHRVHADAAWDRGEHGLALDLYARAALSAYKFQVDMGDPDIPPLVEYTQAFMAEMHERAAARLAAMRLAGEDETVRAAAARVRGFFAPYWRAVAAQPGTPDVTGLIAGGQAAEAVGLLFPPVPEAADLHQPDTAYALTANKVLYRMKRELAKPPGTPLPAG